MFTLGINAAFHDSAAAIVQDGRLIAASEEERFTRIKHAKRPVPFSAYELPFHAISDCLRQAGISMRDVDHVAYSYDSRGKLGSRFENPFIQLPMIPSESPVQEGFESDWEPLFLCYIANAPRQLASAAPHHLASRFKGLDRRGPKSWHFVEHHVAHAASAYHASPFDDAAVLTLDGRGELCSTTYSVGRGTDLHRLGEVHMPNSLGMLYEDITSYLGFLHSSDEYKVMALAAFGKPAFLEYFRSLVVVDGEGRYRVLPHDLERDLGPKRDRGAAIDQRHFDIAHSLQRVLEERVLELCRWLHRASGSKNLCMAGGVALNCVMNSYIRDHGPFEEVWIQPAAGDAGTALGAALLVDAKVRQPSRKEFSMQHAFWGPSYSDGEIEEFLRWAKQPYRKMQNVADEVAEILLNHKVIGWMQGRMEFGPRALGGRSILASPLSATMQDRLNEIKDREDFRPVAPVVLEAEAANWFEGSRVSPFMLFVNNVLPGRRHQVPAICHADGTARIQTVRRDQNEPYYDLIAAFARKTGVPILVNTSFNSRGEPVVCSPRDAVECFWSSPLDALVIGSFVIGK